MLNRSVPRRKFALVALATLFTGVWVSVPMANAAPDPVFDTAIDDIRQALPEGWQFRLPSTLLSEGELYPFVSESSDTTVVISLGVTPDCAASNCTIGMFGATDSEEALSSWPPEGNSVSTFEMGDRLEGYHLVQGAGPGANRLVMWRQDGLTYAIATLAEAMTEAQLIEVARSTAFETPIGP
ncbi:MAG: hypothetical protein AAFQ40_00155 [Cyanobacteria bacterium J06623_5]